MRLPTNALSFKRLLLRWYRRQARDLPWRTTRDAYAIVVSEFMLQQTQVSRVLEYFPRFLRRYPTVHHLSRATPRQVRESWEGLGYYRRAENLHRLAKTIVREHEGEIPDDPERLRDLPGVGRYTAGAVAAFAYERRVAAVDTNVARVLTRVFGLRLPKGARREHRLWALASALLPKRRRAVWEFNQALMDLGATVCRARGPLCSTCPVRTACRTGRRLTSSGGSARARRRGRGSTPKR
ncbi:MAG TPA: A/G-specific adenine glycosylase [Gemmatimonadales bacterium]|nr:A/G-specific adenine glycosylase [Gemmatimonadales bacterium]